MAWAATASTRLENERLLLRPVQAGDREAWRAIAMDPDIWCYFVTMIENDADFDAFFDAALADQGAGRRVVFHIHDRDRGRAAGSMSFGYIAEQEARIEIGWSWLGRDFRSRGVNSQAKFLMLEHAFEVLGAERVQFRTDVLNLRARRALANIGATEEGVLRSYNPMPGGRRRDAMFYSVLRAEWPAIKDQIATGASAHPVGPIR